MKIYEWREAEHGTTILDLLAHEMAQCIIESPKNAQCVYCNDPISDPDQLISIMLCKPCTNKTRSIWWTNTAIKLPAKDSYIYILHTINACQQCNTVLIPVQYEYGHSSCFCLHH
jgi:hypothetical protein